MLGIGIITYNRRETLKKCVQGVLEHTRSPYALVVADDGSTDGTADALRALDVEYLTGPNGGAGRNKNRALLALLHLTDCDPIILLEDDCIPSAPGWEARWVEAAARLHHCNVVLPSWEPWFAERRRPGGDGTPGSPYWWEGFTGQCTVSSRWALSRVGFLEPLFQGFGEEHVEWTRRFGRLLGWPAAQEWSGQYRWGGYDTPMIDAPDLAFPDAGTFFDAEQTATNQEIHALIKDGPIYRPPARTAGEQEALAASVGKLLVRRSLRRLPDGEPQRAGPSPNTSSPNTFRLRVEVK